MPIIESSSYIRRPWYFPNSHLETILPSLIFKVNDVHYERERIELFDGDFLDLDWLRSGSSKLVILSHGLEGNSHRHYIMRPAKYFHDRGWDALAWNCRSCSGEINRKARFYHHGDTQDLLTVIKHATKERNYEQIVLVGFSMGGSMGIKLLGEMPDIDHQIKGAIGFSVPCNLRDSAIELSLPKNRLYEQKFMKKLIKKLIAKAPVHPNEIDLDRLDKIHTFEDFHRYFTAPLHGFSTVDEFYDTATCDRYIDGLNRPVLVVNAINDPLLARGCYPIHYAQKNPFLYLEMPKLGGHVGFTKTYSQASWMEERSWQFAENIIASNHL